MITRNAYAKINLSLEVTGRRDDGYHNIVSVMQLVDLHDTLTFSLSDELSVQTDNPTVVLEDQSNLVWQAARLLQETAGVSKGASIQLQKRIPVAAGLGGGSSDAAAALLGLSELWGVRLARDEMHALAARLGSDVPFFLNGPTALVEGRGEWVTRIPSPVSRWAVLVSQPYAVESKTRRLYENLSKHDMTDGSITRQLISAILEGDFRPSLLYNGFERTAYNIFKDLHRVRQQIAQTGGRAVHLSGSGPTLYVLFAEKEAAKARGLYEALQAQGLKTFLTHTLTMNN